MFYYNHTLQKRALRLMASKLSAATVIEGNISEEGLAALSDCEDMTTQLAKELVSGLRESVEDLSVSFRKMALLGNRRTEKEKTQDVIPITPTPLENMSDKATNSVIISLPEQYNTETMKTVGKTIDIGQLSIFDLIAS